MVKKENEQFVSDLKEMYKILGKMIKAAEKNDKKETIKLNSDFQVYASKIYPKLNINLRQTYDNCRNSCVSAVGMLVSMHDELMVEAKQLYSQIPKP